MYVQKGLFMSSLFKLNQLSARKESAGIKEDLGIPLDEKDREIYALRQQLQTLKTLYKNTKSQTASSPKNIDEISSESTYSKQRIEKLMAALAEREKQKRVLQQESKQQIAQAIDEWQKEKQAKQMALDEVAALRSQLEFLKSKVVSSQNALKAQQELIQTLLDERAKEECIPEMKPPGMNL